MRVRQEERRKGNNIKKRDLSRTLRKGRNSQAMGKRGKITVCREREKNGWGISFGEPSTEYRVPGNRGGRPQEQSSKFRGRKGGRGGVDKRGKARGKEVRSVVRMLMCSLTTPFRCFATARRWLGQRGRRYNATSRRCGEFLPQMEEVARIDIDCGSLQCLSCVKDANGAGGTKMM